MGTTAGNHNEGRRPRMIFFSGTDTGVGKTYVASLAAAELRHSGNCVAVYKPVASGCLSRGDELISDDALALWQAAGRRGSLHDVCPQRFAAALAPPQAAAAVGRRVDDTRLVSGLAAVAADADVVLVEGAGGLLSPLSDRWLNSDLVLRLGAELVIVAANRLGVIHQVLATVMAARSLRLPVLGIVLCGVEPLADASAESNAAAIGRFTRVPILGQVAHRAVASGIRWAELPPAEAPAEAAGGGAPDELTRAWL